MRTFAVVDDLNLLGQDGASLAVTTNTANVALVISGDVYAQGITLTPVQARVAAVKLCEFAWYVETYGGSKNTLVMS
jgi:hypothetical protein